MASLFSRKTNNFDFLRLLFASTVAIVHAAFLTRLPILDHISQFLSSQVAVDSFFVISGFLIFMSYDSTSTLKKYISKRARRIFPAYCMVVISCALLFSLISSKSMGEYFMSREFVKYLVSNLTTLNFFQHSLPGVFENNFSQTVNGALWTIKIEVMFYISVPFIAYFLRKYNKAKVLAMVYVLSLLYASVMGNFASLYHSSFFTILARQLPGQLSLFISGTAIYYYYPYFKKYSLQLLVFSIAVIVVNKYFFNIHYLYPICLATIVLYVATLFKYHIKLDKFGDISYGVYIWHFPVVQLFCYFGLLKNPVWGSVAMFFTIALVAFLSWHLLEKRFLFRARK